MELIYMNPEILQSLRLAKHFSCKNRLAKAESIASFEMSEYARPEFFGAWIAPVSSCISYGSGASFADLYFLDPGVPPI